MQVLKRATNIKHNSKRAGRRESTEPLLADADAPDDTDAPEEEQAPTGEEEEKPDGGSLEVLDCDTLEEMKLSAHQFFTAYEKGAAASAVEGEAPAAQAPGGGHAADAGGPTASGGAVAAAAAGPRSTRQRAALSPAPPRRKQASTWPLLKLKDYPPKQSFKDVLPRHNQVRAACGACSVIARTL